MDCNSLFAVPGGLWACPELKQLEHCTCLAWVDSLMKINKDVSAHLFPLASLNQNVASINKWRFFNNSIQLDKRVLNDQHIYFNHFSFILKFLFGIYEKLFWVYAHLLFMMDTRRHKTPSRLTTLNFTSPPRIVTQPVWKTIIFDDYRAKKRSIISQDECKELPAPRTILVSVSSVREANSSCS